MKATTQSGYIVSAWQLPTIEAPVIAVLGIRATEGTRRSLIQDILLRTRSALARSSGPGTDDASAALFYLAQIGLLRTRDQDGEGHVSWPPIRDGAVVADRRDWRRPYLSQMTRQALDKKVLPRAVAELLQDPGKKIDDALELYGTGTLLRADDPGLHDAVRWYDGALGYPRDWGATAPGIVVREVLEQLAAGAWTSVREALSATIERLAAENDSAALATLLGFIRGGHSVVHTAIRHHQLRALEELREVGKEWSRVCELALGLNRLMYEPIALLGNESWQFSTQGRKLRITLPEVIGLGRDAIGRDKWWRWCMAPT